MILEWLGVADFRNIVQASLDFHPELNLLIGGNGHGKSNLLEAVGLLATGRSFRRSPPETLRRHGFPGFRLHGVVSAFDLTHRLDFHGLGNRQTARLDGKSMTLASTAMGRVLAAVLLTPDSPDLIHGGPGERRDYLDWVVFSSHRSHAGTVRDYQAALKARNRLLKRPPGSVQGAEMDAWEDRLAVLGGHIVAMRRETIRQFKLKIPPYLEAMGLDGERFQMGYGCQLDRWPDAVDAGTMVQRYRELLAQGREGDFRSKSTSHGPHRDDVHFLMENRPLGRFGSRGQRKRFILALKMAQLELLREAVQAPPLLLLDDPMAEMDAEGMDRLMRLVCGRGHQLFISACNLRDIPCSPWPHRAFMVENGHFKHLTELQGS